MRTKFSGRLESAYRQKFVKFCARTHTHTKLVVEIYSTSLVGKHRTWGELARQMSNGYMQDMVEIQSDRGHSGEMVISINDDNSCWIEEMVELWLDS